MFTDNFDSIIVDGDTIRCEVEGFQARATAHYDSDTQPDADCDPEMLVAWQQDEWHYFGVVVHVWRDGVRLTGDFAHARWGIDGNVPGGNNTYFRVVANELLPDAITEAKDRIAKWAQEVA